MTNWPFLPLCSTQIINCRQLSYYMRTVEYCIVLAWGMKNTTVWFLHIFGFSHDVIWANCVETSWPNHPSPLCAHVCLSNDTQLIHLIGLCVELYVCCVCLPHGSVNKLAVVFRCDSTCICIVGIRPWCVNFRDRCVQTVFQKICKSVTDVSIFLLRVGLWTREIQRTYGQWHTYPGGHRVRHTTDTSLSPNLVSNSPKIKSPHFVLQC